MKTKLAWRAPLFDYFTAAAQVEEWQTVAGAQIVSRFRDENAAGALMFADLSPLPRAGVKGGDWSFLTQTPEVNKTLTTAEGACIARVGGDELLLLANDAGKGMPDVPADALLPRRDSHFCFGMRGAAAADLLARLSALPPPQNGEIQQTIIAETAGWLLRDGDGEKYRWLADASMAAYCWETLGKIAGALGGGAVGWAAWRAAD